MTLWHWAMLYYTPGILILVFLLLAWNQVRPEVKDNPQFDSLPLWFKVSTFMLVIPLWPMFLYLTYKKRQEKRRIGKAH